jgi:ornithine cyclodeaminase/alanine dehydrogenase
MISFRAIMPERILYLSEADIARLGLTATDVLAALESGLAASREKSFTVPKLGLPIGAGRFFSTMPVASAALGLGGMKWVGVDAANSARGLPNVSALVVLNSFENGRPVAVMGGEWITAVRTAAMSAAAAKRLASPESATIGFIGTGLQARSHLDALRPLFPRLKRALLRGRSEASLASFERYVREAELEPVRAGSAEEVMDAAEVLVTTVPAQPGFKPFLEGGRVRPGGFVAMVDLGRSWLPQSFSAFDVIATDEREQSTAHAHEGKMPYGGPWSADLVELVTAPPPRDPKARTAFLFAGMALSDLIVAATIFERAKDRNAGTWLPL